MDKYCFATRLRHINFNFIISTRLGMPCCLPIYRNVRELIKILKFTKTCLGTLVWLDIHFKIVVDMKQRIVNLKNAIIRKSLFLYGDKNTLVQFLDLQRNFIQIL